MIQIDTEGPGSRSTITRSFVSVQDQSRPKQIATAVVARQLAVVSCGHGFSDEAGYMYDH